MIQSSVLKIMVVMIVKKASPWQLQQLGITDPHTFKKEILLGGSIARYDICICKDGSVRLKAQGKCGKPGPSIDTFMKVP